MLPARESDFAASIARYDDELHKLADGMRVKTARTVQIAGRRLVQIGLGSRTSRARRRRAAAEVPYLNFAELDNAIAKLEQSARAFDKEYARARTAGDDPARDRGTASGSMRR